MGSIILVCTGVLPYNRCTLPLAQCLQSQASATHDSQQDEVALKMNGWKYNYLDYK